MAARERASSVLNLQSGQTSFLPGKIPKEIQKMIPISAKITKDLFRRLLQMAIKDLNGGAISEEHFQAFKSMFNSLQEEQFWWLYTGVLLLMKYALRNPYGTLKKESFVRELKELRLIDDHIEDVSRIVFSDKHQTIEKRQLSNVVRLPTLTSLRWRVDVTISTSVLNRVLEPTILMEMRNSKGEVVTFEVSQSKFHELRYNVACLLKEMEDVERKHSLLNKLDT